MKKRSRKFPTQKLEELSSRREFLESLGSLLVMASQASSLGMLLKPALAQAAAKSAGGLKQFVHIYLKGGTNMLSSYLSPTAKRPDDQIPDAWKCIGLGNSFYPGTAGISLFGKSATSSVPVAPGLPLYLRRIKVGDYWMPILWNSNIPTVGGTQVKMSELIRDSGCSLIYGLHSSPAHDLAAGMYLEPRPGAPTLGGFIADQANDTVFGAITTRGSLNRFRAPSGISARVVNTGPQAMNELLSSLINRETGSSVPFSKDRLSGEASQWVGQMKSSIQSALQVIKQDHNAQSPGVSALFDLTKTARNELDNTVYEEIVLDFLNTSEKYRNLVTQAFGMGTLGNGLVGINDQGAILGFPEGSPCITQSGLPTWNHTQDFRQYLSTMSFATDSLPYEFALAEIVVRRKLSRTLQIGFDPLIYTSLGYMGSDNHVTGHAIDLAVIGSFMHVFNTLLYEFIQALKISGNYDTTMLLVNSEFTRNPRADGSGSDHNFDGAMAALFSGKLSTPLRIYGSVDKLEIGTNYPGLFGQAQSEGLIDVRRLSYSIGRLFGVTNASFSELGNFLTPIMNLNSQGGIEFTIPNLKDPIS